MGPSWYTRGQHEQPEEGYISQGNGEHGFMCVLLKHQSTTGPAPAYAGVTTKLHTFFVHPTLCGPMGCSLAGSPVPEILQAKILK